jgi:hypothetical protein
MHLDKHLHRTFADVICDIYANKTGLAEGATIIKQHLDSQDAELYRPQVQWLAGELRGYDMKSFPPTYTPPARRISGKPCKHGDIVPPLVSHYRALRVWVPGVSYGGRGRFMINLVPLATIDEWGQKLAGKFNMGLVVGRSKFGNVITNSFSVGQLRRNLILRLGDLINDVCAA